MIPIGSKSLLYMYVAAYHVLLLCESDKKKNSHYLYTCFFRQRECPYDGCLKNYINMESFVRHLKSHEVEGGVSERPSQKSSTELSGTPPPKEELGSTTMEGENVQPALGTQFNVTFSRTVPGTNRVSESAMSSNGDKQQQQLKSKLLVARDVPDKTRSLYDHLKHGKDYWLSCSRGETPRGMDALIDSVDRRSDQMQFMVPPNSSVSILPSGYAIINTSRDDVPGLNINRACEHLKKGVICHEL